LLILLDLTDILTFAPSKFLNVEICWAQSLNFSEAHENHQKSTMNTVFHHDGDWIDYGTASVLMKTIFVICTRWQ
jgi:hypothetical protein